MVCVCLYMCEHVCICLCVCLCMCVTAHVFQNCKMSTWTFKSPTYVRLRPLASLAKPPPHRPRALHRLPLCHPPTRTHTHALTHMCVWHIHLASLLKLICTSRRAASHPSPTVPHPFPFPCCVLVAVVWLTVSQPPPRSLPYTVPPQALRPWQICIRNGQLHDACQADGQKQQWRQVEGGRGRGKDRGRQSSRQEEQ